MKTYSSLFALAAVATALPSSAQPVVLDVDQSQSSLSLSITLDTPLGSRSDSDSTAITGQMTIELDDYASPTIITVLDYDFAPGPLSFVFDYGFLGSINASTAGAVISMPSGAAPVMGAVDGLGDFVVNNVPNEMTGTINVSGSGAIGGLLDDTTVDLSTLSQPPIQISGNVDIDANTITISVILPLDGQGTDPDTGVTVTLAGSAVVLATGLVPDEPCLADVNHDGAVTPADFSAWIAAYNAGATECDQNGDGACTPADFTAWIANFNAGCP